MNDRKLTRTALLRAAQLNRRLMLARNQTDRLYPAAAEHVLSCFPAAAAQENRDRAVPDRERDVTLALRAGFC